MGSKRKKKPPTEAERLFAIALGHLEADLEDDKLAFIEGHPDALCHALLRCKAIAERDHGRPAPRVQIPDWIFHELYNLAAADMLARPIAKAGRSATWGAYTRQLAIDSARYYAVRQCRKEGSQWVSAYADAAEHLRGRYAEGGAEAIKKSYQRYRRRLLRELPDFPPSKA